MDRNGNCTILIPEVNKKKVTPLSEAYQAVIWQCLVSHPKLQIKKKQMVNLKTLIFADGADLKSIVKLNSDPMISGFTTNPSLMKKAGIVDYKKFALEVLKIVKKKPVSFEVFSDEINDMERQAREISSWGENVYVKIPITNSKKIKTNNLVKKLSMTKLSAMSRQYLL